MKSSTKNPTRSANIRAQWREHIAAQRVSGQSQVGYCREHNLNPKYFYLWKSKLRAEATPVASAPKAPVLIPLSIRADSSPAVEPTQTPGSRDFMLKAILPNGVTIECTLPSEAVLLSVFSQLAQRPC